MTTEILLEDFGIETVNIPADAPPGPEFTCEVCNVELEYSGRGRKPRFCAEHKRGAASAKSSASPRRGNSAEVRSAMATLEQFYGMISLGLMMVSPNAATTWASQLDQLQASNQLALTGDKALCRSINRLGEASGKGMFVVAHAMAAAPVAGALAQDLGERRKAKQKARAEAQGYLDYPAEETPTTPANEQLAFFG